MADYERYGGELPPALANQPKLDIELMMYHKAFNELSSHRTYTESGPNPISYVDLQLYGRINGFCLTAERRQKFEKLIRACDSSFLEYSAEQRQQAMEAARAKMKSA